MRWRFQRGSGRLSHPRGRPLTSIRSASDPDLACTSDEIDRLTKETDPTSEAEFLPHAGILGQFAFPMGLKAEGLFLPGIENSYCRSFQQHFYQQRPARV